MRVISRRWLYMLCAECEIFSILASTGPNVSSSSSLGRRNAGLWRVNGGAEGSVTQTGEGGGREQETTHVSMEIIKKTAFSCTTLNLLLKQN